MEAQRWIFICEQVLRRAPSDDLASDQAAVLAELDITHIGVETAFDVLMTAATGQAA